jgi:hypothetical protein
MYQATTRDWLKLMATYVVILMIIGSIGTIVYYAMLHGGYSVLFAR